jgi:hypothetical protein
MKTLTLKKSALEILMESNKTNVQKKNRLVAMYRKQYRWVQFRKSENVPSVDEIKKLTAIKNALKQSGMTQKQINQLVF